MANKFQKISKEQYIKDCKDKFNFDYEDIKLPRRATKFSSGYDIFSPITFRLRPGESIKIPTCIRIQLDEDKWLAIIPRSGLGFKYRLQLDNTVGNVDADYFYSDNEGHIWIKISNDSNESKTLEISAGEGIAQGIILPYYKTEDDVADGIRNGGFGSTNKKDYSLPLGYDMYDNCYCGSKCKTPCGRKQAPKEQVFTSSDFTYNCTRFQIDLDQFDSVFEAAYVAQKAAGEE